MAQYVFIPISILIYANDLGFATDKEKQNKQRKKEIALSMNFDVAFANRNANV